MLKKRKKLESSSARRDWRNQNPWRQSASKARDQVLKVSFIREAFPQQLWKTTALRTGSFVSTCGCRHCRSGWWLLQD